MEVCKKDYCTGCGLCTQLCPAGCITMGEDSEGFLYPVVAEEDCLHCNKCRTACPVQHQQELRPATFYMAWHKDEEVLEKSSSGGVFTALAQIILARGGVVFGAALDFSTRDIKHRAVEAVEDLDILRLSKYYQSDAAISYGAVRDCLQAGRWVLFTGTPCQIAALYAFLGKADRTQLITMDVLCHGVTSKAVVEAYLRGKERKYKGKITQFFFRVKTNSIWWDSGGTSMKLVFHDGRVRYEHLKYDTFFTGFNEFLFLRESCYRCKFCGTKRIGDFSAADYWSVPPTSVPSKQLRLGVSLLLVNTDKGRGLLRELQQYMDIEVIEAARPVAYNRALSRPGRRHEKRDAFLREVRTGDFDRLVKSCCWKYYAKTLIKSALLSVLGENNYARVKRIVKVK